LGPNAKASKIAAMRRKTAQGREEFCPLPIRSAAMAHMTARPKGKLVGAAADGSVRPNGPVRAIFAALTSCHYPVHGIAETFALSSARTAEIFWTATGGTSVIELGL